tara:strand:- start:131 stop:847 length:717 start_codon:yes stop_codon:yes gene_type:complete
MSEIIDYKAFGGELKDFDFKSRIVTGYLTSFDNVDHGGDVGVKGMFAKSLKERKGNIKFLNQHQWTQPHGGFAVLKEDSKGLYFESEPLINTTYSDDALKLYDAGIMKEHSYGYQTINSEYDKKDDVRYLKEVKLFEGSNVTLGMNPDTPFTGFKSFTNIKELEAEQKKLFTAIKNGTFTDETFMLLEIALKQLQKQAFELGKKSLEETKEPLIIDTPKLDIEPNKDLKTINEFIKNI